MSRCPFSILSSSPFLAWAPAVTWRTSRQLWRRSQACLMRRCPAAIAIHDQQVGGTEVILSRERLYRDCHGGAQPSFSPSLWGEALCLYEPAYARPARDFNPAKAPVHVSEGGHDLLGPRRGVVKPLQVPRRPEDTNVNNPVDDQEARSRPHGYIAATMQEAGNSHPFLYVLMRVPVAIFGPRARPQRHARRQRPQGRASSLEPPKWQSLQPLVRADNDIRNSSPCRARLNSTHGSSSETPSPFSVVSGHEDRAWAMSSLTDAQGVICGVVK